MCISFSPVAARAQTESGGTSTAAKTTTTKTTATKTTHPKPRVKAYSSASKAPSPTSAKSHSATDKTTNKTTQSKTTLAAHNGKSAHTVSRKNPSKSSRKKAARGQQKIEPERAEAIQEALIREHYLSGEAAGTWNQASEDAMRRYQADHGWQSKTVPDSRALISLGLGPSHDHLLNPESAMTTGPEVSHGASVTSSQPNPVAHSAEPGVPTSTTPAVDPAPATPSDHNASAPQ
ncbi:MAG: peptidoglycan-binding domain-containing protein [Candidatus Sulfotelmatobacter sp.]